MGVARRSGDTSTHKPGKIRNDDNGDVADDHYHRYREDVQVDEGARRRCVLVLGFVAADIPGGHRGANRKGLDFYDRLLDELVSNGIEPFLMLYHWDLPQESLVIGRGTSSR